MISDWHDLFAAVKGKPYSEALKEFLAQEYSKHTIYPPRDLVFNAFELTKPEQLKVVIIGQDPYHNAGQAMGLSFSVPQGCPLPPSLQNIYKEIEDDLGVPMNDRNGDLTPWAAQGVLLLNAYLTVREGQPLSHSRAEYDAFIADVMDYIDTLDQPIVFLLWGGFARKYKKYVHHPLHFVLESVHPSPLSANRGGWFGNHHFSKANKLLTENGKPAIDWRIA